MGYRRWSIVAASLLVLLLVPGGGVPAAVLTWTGAGDGFSWNSAANWSPSQAPGFFDTLHITTAGTIGNVYRDTGTNTYRDGSTWRGIVHLNQGTLNLPSYFGTGDNGVFNIGDGVLTGGARDAIVNLAGTWEFDRHGNGTFTLNILRDGALYGGTFLGFGGHPGRNYVINVDGGLMASPNAWNMGADLADVNRVNISNRGTVMVGPLTIDANDIIDLRDRTADFTARFGGSFANLAAVEAALGSNFISSTGPAPMAVDNRNGTFSVGGLLPPTGGTLPGGFAPNAPGSGLLYHLDAAAGVSTDGASVTAWADQSPAGRDFAQGDSNRQPVLQTDGFGPNDLPSVRFDGASPPNNDRLVMSQSTTPHTVVIVNQMVDNPRSLAGIWGRDGGDFGIRWNHNTARGWLGDGNAADWSQQGQSYINGAPGGYATPGTAHILTQTRLASDTLAGTAIGDYWGHTTHVRPYGGDIAEVLVFDRVLNLAELRILDNHLSAKYAIPLAANDHYAGDAPAQGGYHRSVFGIGRVDADNLVFRAGADGFGIASYGLEDGQWLMAGHRSPTNAWVTDDLPPDGRARWERVWYVDETGGIAGATFAFDHFDAGLAAPDPSLPLGLLYSPTNAFDFSILAQNPDVFDGLVLFDLGGMQLQDGYYTLGIIPEPSTLVLFLLGLAALSLHRPSSSSRRQP